MTAIDIQLRIGFLLFDVDSTRSLRYGASVVRDYLAAISGPELIAPARIIGKLHADLRYDDEAQMRRGDFVGLQRREPSQSHAWVEFHSPAAGWVAFDPTHNRAVDERYVVVGHGRHYDDVPPNKGIYRGIAKETLKAEVVTEVVPGKIVATLHVEIRQIDLPVFREVPARPPDRIVTGVEDVSAQQQQ